MQKTCTIIQISVKNTKFGRGLILDRTSHTKLNTSSLIAMSLGARFIRAINYNRVHGMLGL